MPFKRRKVKQLLRSKLLKQIQTLNEDAKTQVHIIQDLRAKNGALEKTSRKLHATVLDLATRNEEEIARHANAMLLKDGEISAIRVALEKAEAAYSQLQAESEAAILKLKKEIEATQLRSAGDAIDSAMHQELHETWVEELQALQERYKALQAEHKALLEQEQLAYAAQFIGDFEG